MTISRVFRSRVSILLPVLLTTSVITASVQGQHIQTPTGPAENVSISASQSTGVASDWSHRHVIFSNLGPADQAVQNGAYDRWLKITNEPRFVMQRRSRGGAAPDLWREDSTATADAESAPDAYQNDEDTSADMLTPSAADSSSGTLRRGLVRALIPPPAQHSGSRPGFHESPVHPNSRDKMNGLQRDWSETIGSSGTTGLGNFPATFTKTSASCTADFAVYNTSLAGSSSQASIIAYNQLYSGCASRPSTDWAFDTGGTIRTSVALSPDGTQVVFVQTDNTTGDADLVVLKWASPSGSLTEPTVLTSNGSYPNCTAPCMISLPFSGNPTDTHSSVFVDYNSGSAYAGDDAGNLHRFTNIFFPGTPAEVTTSWPVTLNTSTYAALSSPVYDSVSGKIFVGDYLADPSSKCEPGVSTAEGQCGYLYSVTASSGTVVTSVQLDYNLGIYDGPIIDSSAGMVYVFVGADNSTSCSSGPCAAVFQFPVDFTDGATGTEATVGSGYEFLMSGSFDNQYFTSGTLPSGHLYVVGGTGAQNNTLYAITISGNAMSAGSATAGPEVATNYTNGYYAGGLQVTEFCNNGSNACTATQGTDYLFLGVLGFGSEFSTNPCPNQSINIGCVMGFTAPMSGTISINATPNGTLQEAGGTSGIVVDNGASGASNIYFSTILSQSCTTSGGTAGCAVSASQAGLQ